MVESFKSASVPKSSKAMREDDYRIFPVLLEGSIQTGWDLKRA